MRVSRVHSTLVTGACSFDRHAIHTGRAGSAPDLSVQIRGRQRRGRQRMGPARTTDHAEEVGARRAEDIGQQRRVHGRLHQLALRQQLRGELEDPGRQRGAHRLLQCRILCGEYTTCIHARCSSRQSFGGDGV